MLKPLLSEEKLALLREMDKERKWYSLDDKRVCTICDRSFIGRQVEVDRDSRGRTVLHCPTPQCPSTINHWFLSGIPRALKKIAGRTRAMSAPSYRYYDA